jgi:hypothetical protein
MTIQEVISQLQGIRSTNDFAMRTVQLTDNWTAVGVDFGSIPNISQKHKSGGRAVENANELTC